MFNYDLILFYIQTMSLVVDDVMGGELVLMDLTGCHSYSARAGLGSEFIRLMPSHFSVSLQ